MVLQREQMVKIWGWDDPGQKVIIRFEDQKVSVTTSDDGRWDVQLQPMVASAIGREMRIKGSSKVTLQDVLIGEVWLCSGQSNMQWFLARDLDADVELLKADNPMIRLITVPQVGTQVPQDDFSGQWDPCTPDIAKDFSAIGYHFANMLQDILDVPVGMIDNAWGGSAAEAWVRRDLLDADPTCAPYLEYWDSRVKTYEYAKVLADFEVQHSEWQATKDAGQKVPREPRKPGNALEGQHRPANLYNGMLNPIIGYGIRGVLWYQGENNANNDRALGYSSLFPLLISSWRNEWGQGDFPFYWVQLADYKSYTDEPMESDWAVLRESQTLTLELPNTGQAVIYDNGEATDIHPKEKLKVARRLLRHALAKDYGFDIAANSPQYCSHQTEGDTIILKICNVGRGLDTFDVNELLGFSIAGEDGKQVWAEATIIDDNQIAVRSPDVPHPVSVRYAWADNPVANVQSKSGLLLTPFRTDQSGMR